MRSMIPILFTVIERPEGWYVDGPHRLGPFPGRASVVELAEELASWVRADGEDALVLYVRPEHETDVRPPRGSSAAS